MTDRSPLERLLSLTAPVEQGPAETLWERLVRQSGLPREIFEGRREMTEAEWLASDNPAEMLEAARKWIAEPPQGPPIKMLLTARQLRLFDDACIDHLDCNWPALARAKGPALARGAALLRDIIGNPFKPVALETQWMQFVCPRCGDFSATSPDYHVRCPTCGRNDNIREKKTAPSAWLRWQNGTVPAMARAIYDGRRWEDMPILADALADAGCTDEAILMHLRGFERCPRCLGTGKDIVRYAGGSYPAKCMCCGEVGPSEFGPGWRPLQGPHCRGCWVIELLRGGNNG